MTVRARAWLLPLVGSFARLVTHGYYRVTVAGAPVPARGPVLLVANHPNMVFDPLLVAVGAGRPVRFLAKAPLFRIPVVGAVLRGAGCLPVHRRSDGDDPALMSQNQATFAAVTAALADGAAVAIFPEGTSHDAPTLAPLKTGAARLALAAVAEGIPVTVIPVGLVMADRDRARSEALVVLGPPVEWKDLSPLSESVEAVRELTTRILTALEAVTLNLELWADEPLVTTAEAVYAATHPVSPDPADRVRRLWQATRWLRALRRSDDSRYRPLAAGLRAHGRKLARMGLTPSDLTEPADWGTAIRWTARRLPVVVAGFMALAGLLLVSGPMILADVLTPSRSGETEARASRHLLLGSVLALGWWAALAMLGGLRWGLPAALALGGAVPLIGFAGLAVQQAWADRLHQARRWFLLRYRGRRRRRLLAEQVALGGALEELVTHPPVEAVA